jgi:Transposase DDE domain
MSNAPGLVPRSAAKAATHIDRMSRTLHTKAGAGVYAARNAIVEPVIGQIKQARGFRQFLLRLQKVQGVWSLVGTPHNIPKLYRLCG